MAFDDELKFESELINLLFEKGWEREVLKYPTEEDLIQNWAAILFKNNSGIDQLNDVPLTVVITKIFVYANFLVIRRCK